MTRRDLARLRAAAHAAVTALFDSLESTQPANTVTRVAAEPDANPSDLDLRRAREMIARRGAG